MSLYSVFAAAAGGSLPAPDGQVEVCGEDPGRAAAVVAFPAHFYVLAPVEPQWVPALLPPGDCTVPLAARFLTALADRLGAGIGSNDAVLAARAHGHGDSLGLRPVRRRGHPGCGAHYRDDVRVGETADGTSGLTLGRGLAGRWEVSFESNRVRAASASAARSPPRRSDCFPRTSRSSPS